MKIDVVDSYYHVYARGASRSTIFFEEADYRFFLALFERYLSLEPRRDSSGRLYTHLLGRVELLAYCLMPNHFHLMFYLEEEGTISTLMRGVMTSYSRYFNYKYDRSGPLFETRYKAVRINSDSYLMHISRYIHLNHRKWESWPWSSYGDYADPADTPEWLSQVRVLDLFQGRNQYIDFIHDYADYQRTLESIKAELANS